MTALLCQTSLFFPASFLYGRCAYQTSRTSSPSHLLQAQFQSAHVYHHGNVNDRGDLRGLSARGRHREDDGLLVRLRCSYRRLLPRGTQVVLRTPPADLRHDPSHAHSHRAWRPRPRHRYALPHQLPSLPRRPASPCSSQCGPRPTRIVLVVVPVADHDVPADAVPVAGPAPAVVGLGLGLGLDRPRGVGRACVPSACLWGSVGRCRIQPSLT
ncbi:hypothetical protein C8Q74DRAFT_920225 [Fomes fomentarius]|nr:hypothetical protein C8Q74DRAFT_920225 [Fomes fomentarius]